jgi:hypothetical protein
MINAHLLRSPRPSSLYVRPKYASLLGMSAALHLDLSKQPAGKGPHKFVSIAEPWLPQQVKYFSGLA